jgi:hypothetical protein
MVGYAETTVDIMIQKKPRISLLAEWGMLKLFCHSGGARKISPVMYLEFPQVSSTDLYLQPDKSSPRTFLLFI